MIYERLQALSLTYGMQFDLKRILSLCERFGNPQNSFRSIHVAGTNGKGSVTHKIAKALELSGIKVGLYTSPHLSSFRERIQVNSQMIAEDEVEELFSKEIEATFFEVLTLLAFLHFKKKEVEIAVIEVGLGGRLDATNIINPILSVITSISLDHTHILGATLDEIAREKGGVIKENTPLVLGPKANLAVLIEMAKEKNAKVILAKEPKDHFYDNENQEIARAALEYLNKGDLRGLLTRPKCRFEEINGVILDVAHNPEAFRRCFLAMENKKINLLLGMSQDKDIKTCLEIAANYIEEIHFIPCDSTRSTSPDDLLKIWHSITDKPAFIYRSFEEGFTNKINLVMGSFYIMMRARKCLGINEPCDPIFVSESVTHVTHKIRNIPLLRYGIYDSGLLVQLYSS